LFLKGTPRTTNSTSIYLQVLSDMRRIRVGVKQIFVSKVKKLFAGGVQNKISYKTLQNM